jgi:tryptophan-rich sensory protein
LKCYVVLLPFLCVYGPTLFLPSQENSAENVSFRPPGWVFAVVWTILCLIIPYVGYNVIFKRNNTSQKTLITVYTLLNLSFIAWLVTYSGYKNKIGGIVTLAISLVLAITFVALSYKNTKSLWLITLIIWLFFAMVINIAEVQNDEKNSEVLDN